MPPFVVTVPAAFSRIAARLLALGRQHVDIQIVDAAVAALNTWAQVLAAGNTSGPSNPTIDAGQELVLAGASDCSVRNSGGRVQLAISGTTRVEAASTYFSLSVDRLLFVTGVTATAQIRHQGTDGNDMLVKAQDGAGLAAGGNLVVEGGDNGTGVGGQVFMQGGAGGTTAGRARVRHDDDADAIVVEGNGSAHTGGQAMRVDQNGLAFFDGTTADKPPVVGAKGGNAALTSLLTTLATMGLITDNTT